MPLICLREDYNKLRNQYWIDQYTPVSAADMRAAREAVQAAIREALSQPPADMVGTNEPHRLL
jgi:hypothetical protein